MNFLEIFFNGVLKQSIPVQTDIITIGRSSDNDIVIKNMGVSSHHAVISKKGNQFFVEDLNSTNGTFLNKQQVSSAQQVNQQDSISIGKHTLKFSEWSQQEAEPAASSIQETEDSTVMMSPRKQTQESSNPSSTQKQFYLLVDGEITGVKKLLLNNDLYKIGKTKESNLRVKGWFIPTHVARIEKIGHSYYFNQLKKNKAKLNGNWINSTIMLSHLDEIKIKKLSLRFLND